MKQFYFPNNCSSFILSALTLAFPADSRLPNDVSAEASSRALPAVTKTASSWLLRLNPSTLELELTFN